MVVRRWGDLRHWLDRRGNWASWRRLGTGGGLWSCDDGAICGTGWTGGATGRAGGDSGPVGDCGRATTGMGTGDSGPVGDCGRATTGMGTGDSGPVGDGAICGTGWTGGVTGRAGGDGMGDSGGQKATTWVMSGETACCHTLTPGTPSGSRREALVMVVSGLRTVLAMMASGVACVSAV